MRPVWTPETDLVGHELVLRVQEVKTCRIELDVTEDHHLQMRLQDVGEKRLVHPGAADGTARVTDDRS